MSSFVYNDTTFTLAAAGNAWDITRQQADGHSATVASGLFPGLTAEQAQARAQALVQSVYPVGVKLVGPDVTHPNTIGDLRIVGPNVAHPNFIHWAQDSTSFTQQR